MSEWKEYKLGEIINLIGGGTPKTSVAEYWNGDIPWLSVVDFNNGKKFVRDTEKKITKLGLEYSSTKLLKKGDIIISARGTVGVIAVLERPMSFNQSCYGIRTSSDIVKQEYLFYLLKDSVTNLIQISHGGVFNTITKETFDNIDVIIPTRKEQIVIAETLSSLDDKIDLLHRQNKTLEQLAETLFRHWFVEEAEAGGELVKLGECVKTTSGGTPRRDTPEFYQDGTFKWVKSKELSGSFLFDTEEHITEDAIKQSSAKILPEKTILIAMYGATVGEFAILATPAACNQAICALLPNDKYPYTYLYLFTKFNKEYIISIAVGSAQQNISQELIKEIEISTNIGLVNKFHIAVEPLINKIKSNSMQIHTLTRLRDTLLPNLMSGNIKIQP